MVAPVEVGESGIDLLVSNGLLKRFCQVVGSRTYRPTIVQKCRTNIPENKSAKCAASVPTGRHNDSWLSMVSSTIYFGKGDQGARFR